MTVGTTVECEPTPTTQRTTRAIIVLWLRRVLVLAVLAAAGYQLVWQWGEVSDTLLPLPWQSVILSFVTAFAGIWLGPLIWHAVLADLGSPIRLQDASAGGAARYVRLRDVAATMTPSRTR